MDVEVQGLTELKELLERKLPEEIQTKALGPALTKAALPIIKEARVRAPVNTGRLRRAIFSFRSNKSTKQKAVRMISVRSGDRHGKNNAWYWRLIEFGHGEIKVKNKKVLGNAAKGWFGKSVSAFPARPFLRPAFEAKKLEAIEAFKRYLGPEIEKAANRYQAGLVNKIKRKFGL